MPRPSARKTNLSTVRATVNDWLRADEGLREELGVSAVTQDMIAAVLHVSRSYVQAVELGKRPLPDGLAESAGRLLGVDPRWILGPLDDAPVTRTGKPWRQVSFRGAWSKATSFPKSPFTGKDRAQLGIIHQSIRREVEGMLSALRYRHDGKRHSRALLAAVEQVKRDMRAS